MKDNSTKLNVLYIILFVAVFLLLQFIFQMVATAVYSLIYNVSFTTTMNELATGKQGALLVIISTTGNIATLVLFLSRKWTVVSNSYLASRPWAVLLWSCLLAIGAILPLEFIYEQINLQMPAHMQELFNSMMKEPWGYLALGIFAPVAEEVVFRGAILRSLLNITGKSRHWIAIIISAIIFGAVHMNAAQSTHAFIIGLLLGWMYYRTGSLVPGIALHWVNNTIAFVMYHIMPQMADGKLINFFHGDTKLMYGGLLFSLCILIPSIFQLSLRMKHADE